jgi:hypothetical protein
VFSKETVRGQVKIGTWQDRDKSRQDRYKTRLVRSGEDRTGQDRTGQDIVGLAC